MVGMLETVMEISVKVDNLQLLTAVHINGDA
jgi:hypothetical protein